MNPRRVRDLPPGELRRRLRGAGLALRTGPVAARVRSPLEEVASGIALHYAAHPLEPDDGFCDFHVEVSRPRGFRRFVKPQVVFRVDGESPFTPLPGDQGFPMLEWGLNWCFTNLCHQYLTLHAAVVERGGHAIVLPAPPGSGKSTLCAGLAFRGWRLMSDELAVLDIGSDASLVAVPRPISLKNASIDVIRSFAPEAAFNRPVRETIKGTVAHARPPEDAVLRADQRARVAWIVLPKWQAGAPTRLEPLTKARALMRLVENAFNPNVHGRAGFECLADVVDGAETFEFSYSRLDEACALFDRLAEQRSRRDAGATASSTAWAGADASAAAPCGAPPDDPSPATPPFRPALAR